MAESITRLQTEIEDPLNEDKYMLDEHISSREIKANFMLYKNCLKRFRVSAEEFFRLLANRNNLLENVDEDSDLKGKQKDTNAEEVWDGRERGGIEYLAKVPIELKVLILQFSGPKGFFKML